MESLAELKDVEQILQRAGYNTQLAPLGRFSRVLLAENPYALLAALEVEAWDDLLENVSDVQAELTVLASQADRLSIRWDLYVLIHVRTPGLHSVPFEIIDQVESDTKYARKFVRVNLARDSAALDRALRPFLPLRPALSLEPADPIALVRSELLEQGLPSELVERAVASFRSSGEVTVR